MSPRDRGYGRRRGARRKRERGRARRRGLPTEFEAELTGEGHGIETNASGHAHFEVEEREERAGVYYELVVDCIRDVTMAHTHLGAEGEDGPIVVWLYPEEGREPEPIEGVFRGTLVSGTYTAPDDFVGPLEGLSLEGAHGEIAAQSAYVNVHTEQLPGGEIRGQIVPAGQSEEANDSIGIAHRLGFSRSVRAVPVLGDSELSFSTIEALLNPSSGDSFQASCCIQGA